MRVSEASRTEPTRRASYFVMKLVAPLAPVLVLVVLTLGAGTASPGEFHPGIATGTAVPCAGPLDVPTAHLGIYAGTHLVARRTVPSGDRFRFALPPGRYTISNEGHYEPTPTFRIRAGRTTRVVVRDGCM